MTEGDLPSDLTLTDGAMAMDGGSIHLQGIDQSGERVDLYLDRSIGSQRAGTTQLYVNAAPVARGSQQESLWLELVRRASVRNKPAPEDAHGTSISENRIVLAEDAAAYFQAIDQGPEAAIACLAAHLVSLVSSVAYRGAHAPTPSPLPVDPVMSLLAEGKKTEAIKAYREAHPDVGMLAARLAVEALAEEMRIAAQRAGSA